MTDTGLACALLGVNSQTIWEDKTLLGQVLETFVYQELRKLAGWHDENLNFYHFRNKDKVEVDIVIEQGTKFAGIEVKAAATVKKDDFKALNKLKEALGEKFASGIVFYDGDHILPFGERLYAVPLSLLAPPAVKQ
jgi:hypothetical protein